jgi:hypothetical protein
MPTIRQPLSTEVMFAEEEGADVVSTIVRATNATPDATEIDLAVYSTTAADANDQVYLVDAIIAGLEVATGNVITMRINAAVKHVSSIWYPLTETDIYFHSDFTTADARIDAFDTDPGTIKVLVTGEAATDIQWSCEMTVKKLIVVV